MSEPEKKWDFKQLSVGGGTVLVLLLAFQDKGIDLMNRSQDMQAKLVLERTQNNSQRISKMEMQIRELDAKIDRGFESMRAQIRSENEKLGDLIRLGSNDRWTRTDQNLYSDSIDKRFYRIELEINKLTARNKEK